MSHINPNWKNKRNMAYIPTLPAILKTTVLKEKVRTFADTKI